MYMIYKMNAGELDNRFLKASKLLSPTLPKARKMRPPIC